MVDSRASMDDRDVLDFVLLLLFQIVSEDGLTV